MTRDEALATDEAERTAWCKYLDALVAAAPPDPLGYDTDWPFAEVANEMADDAISGRNDAVVRAELARCCRRHK